MEVNAVLITGANRGIGLAFVKYFVTLPTPPKYIFATCRSVEASTVSSLFRLVSHY